MSPRDTTLGTPTKRRIHGVKGLRRETLTISTGFVKPDTLSYNTVIASCGQWHMALRLLQDMTRHQVLEMDGAGHGGVWIEKWLCYMFTSDLLGVQGCRIMIAVDSWNPTLHQKRILCSTRCHVSMAQLPFPQFISEIYPTLCLFNRIQPNNVQTNSPLLFQPSFPSPPFPQAVWKTEFSLTSFRQVRCNLASYMAALQCCTVASQWQKAMLLGQIIKTKTLDVEVPWQWRQWVWYGARLGCHCMVVNDLDACRVVELWSLWTWGVCGWLKKMIVRWCQSMSMITNGKFEEVTRQVQIKYRVKVSHLLRVPTCLREPWFLDGGFLYVFVGPTKLRKLIVQEIFNVPGAILKKCQTLVTTIVTLAPKKLFLLVCRCVRAFEQFRNSQQVRMKPLGLK